MVLGPSRIGRYEIVREIASGGMGRVYLGRVRGPLGFEKLVALKTVHPDLASEGQFVDMFLDEARIAARIDHPNVCRVFDFGEAEGQYYIAMEYLVGENVSRILRKLVKDRVVEPSYDALAARIVAEAAEGLHAAHELTDEHGRSLGVVHRDVSPQNVFVTYDGGVRVVDFGIASAEGRLHQTTTGTVKGKFAYMAPEQMRREKVDRRADVWALGILLWEMLTWERAYKASNEIELVLSVMNDPVRRPSSIRASIDPALEAIVMRALEKDVTARYPTARELAQALNRWIVGKNEVIGLAELSAFMGRVLPEEKRNAIELVEKARKTDPSQVVPLTGTPTIPMPTEGVEVAPVEVSVTTPRIPKPEQPRRGPSPLALGAAAGALLAMIAGVAWALGATPLGPADEGPVEGRDGPVEPPDAAVFRVDAMQPHEGAHVAPQEPEDAAGPARALVIPRSEAGRVAVPPPVDAGPTERESTKTVARPRTGLLIVETPGGWADVYANGERIGRTPLRTELPVGVARIELRPFGLAPGASDQTMRHAVSISGVRPARLFVSLAP